MNKRLIKKPKKQVRFELPHEISQQKDYKYLSNKERLTKLNILIARDLFLSNYGMDILPHKESLNLALMVKIGNEYLQVRDSSKNVFNKLNKTIEVSNAHLNDQNSSIKSDENVDAKKLEQNNSKIQYTLDNQTKDNIENDYSSLIRNSIIDNIGENRSSDSHLPKNQNINSKALVTSDAIGFSHSKQISLRRRFIKPKWHPPQKLKTVLSGHLGQVRSVAMDPANEQFVTGSNDRTIKIQDLASGQLKLTLTGHINAVTGLAVSERHPYMFSVGDDKTVRCQDLEQNKTIRSYHGHLSGVYDVAIHPHLDIIVTCGRDSSVRVWDIRTKAQIHILTGHKNTVAAVKCQNVDPQIISGSHDTTIRLWDLRKGRSSAVLTNHKKSVRDLAIHQNEFSFASASADNLKIQRFPEGQFLRNLSGCDSIVNTLSLNSDENILISGGDEGTLKFQDQKTSHCFQTIKAPPQPGSLDSECGIYASTFDITGTRFITAEADKTIKIWHEDDTATPETHPVNFQISKKRKKKY